MSKAAMAAFRIRKSEKQNEISRKLNELKETYYPFPTKVILELFLGWSVPLKQR